jgi:hypothetical protein
VPFAYDPPCVDELRQGEILAAVTDYRTKNPAEVFGGADPEVDLRLHSRMVVVTSDCDLLKDYTERRKPQANWNLANFVEHVLLCDIYTVDEIITPASFSRHEWKPIRANQSERYHCFPAADVRRTPAAAAPGTPSLPRFRSRWGGFVGSIASYFRSESPSPPSAEAQGGQGPVAAAQGAEEAQALMSLPELILDFKKSTGMPPESVYACIAANQITRVARVPDVFLQDLTHRLYGYLSRVGPDFRQSP